jgi:hypothetical protein
MGVLMGFIVFFLRANRYFIKRHVSRPGKFVFLRLASAKNRAVKYCTYFFVVIISLCFILFTAVLLSQTGYFAFFDLANFSQWMGFIFLQAMYSIGTALVSELVKGVLWYHCWVDYEGTREVPYCFRGCLRCGKKKVRYHGAILKTNQSSNFLSKD